MELIQWNRIKAEDDMTAFNHNSAKRFDFRIAAPQKELIERAASFMGLSLTQFATTTLVDRAQEVIQSYSNTVLSNQDRDIFLSLLDEDATPSASMFRASERYKKLRDTQFERKSTSIEHLQT